MNELLQAIADHLTFYGYRIVTNEGGVPPEVFSATHATRPLFWVLPIGSGALLRALFSLGAESVRDTNALNSFVNDANGIALTGRYFVSEGSLVVAAWYVGTHERERFDAFFQQYLADISFPATIWTDRVAELFGTTVAPTDTNV